MGNYLLTSSDKPTLYMKEFAKAKKRQPRKPVIDNKQIKEWKVCECGDEFNSLHTTKCPRCVQRAYQKRKREEKRLKQALQATSDQYGKALEGLAKYDRGEIEAPKTTLKDYLNKLK